MAASQKIVAARISQPSDISVPKLSEVRPAEMPMDGVPQPAGLQPVVVVTERREISAIPASLRHDLIAQAAYARAQARGFAPGGEVEDWLAAEIEVDDLIRARYL